jgi:hypothetical protein
LLWTIYVKIGKRTENKDMIMERDRIKVEGRIMVVSHMKIWRSTENEYQIIGREKMKVEGGLM